MIKLFSASLLLATACLAQEPDSQAPASFRGMVRLNRAPVSNEVLHVKLPRPVERQLSNGIRLLILESHRAPTVSLTISIPSSHLRDPAGLHGAPEAPAAMMQLGTATRSARQISEALADIGANLNISVGGGGGGGGRGGGFGGGGDTGSISLSSLTENFDVALSILTDVLLHPSFPEDDFAKWKSRQLSAIEQIRTSPNALANELLLKVLYPNDARQT